LPLGSVGATASRSSELLSVSGLILLVIAAAAAVVCFLHARRLVVGRASWLAFGSAGVGVALTHLVSAIGADNRLAAWILVTSYAAFTMGAAFAIYELDRGDLLDVVLDSALVLALLPSWSFAGLPHLMI
jgi:hypothetical protein